MILFFSTLKRSLLFNSRHFIVTDCSSLSSQFNNVKQNFQSILVKKQKGLFGHPKLVDHNGFYILRDNAVVQANSLVIEAISKNRKRKMVQVFDELSNCLCKVADLAEFVRISHPDRNYAFSAEQASITINNEVEKLNTNRELYDALLQVVKNGDFIQTSSMDEYVAKLFLFDFEQCGIHLDEEVRNEVVKLNEHILHVGTYFMHGTTKPRIIPKNDIPERFWKFFQLENDDVVISGLQNEASDPQLREIAFKNFLQHDDHQNQLLLELIYSRLKLAKICGFDSFAHRAINGSIAETPDFVWDLLNSVNNMVRPKSEIDFRQMSNLKYNEKADGKLMQWDVPYCTQTYKSQRFKQDIQHASPFFSLGTCMEGLDMIFNSIFNVQLRICDTNDEDLWHPSVIKLSVEDLYSREVLGLIYCDFFMRPNKPHHDCHFTIQGGCQLQNGQYQNPIVVVFLNFPNGTSSHPTLLLPSMVDNLFHEMGHAMHSMLARTPYQHITGTRCSTDLAEIPSIFMENFASDHRVVQKFSKHFQTGAKINESLLRSWIESKKVFSASDLQLQIFYAALDQVYHSENPLRGCANTTEVLNQIQDQYYGISNDSNISWQLRFNHLVGYGSKYYSYLVSKSVANSIWNRFFNQDPLSRSAGEYFRENVLAHGGGKPPKSIVESVLDQKISAQSLAESLSANI